MFEIVLVITHCAVEVVLCSGSRKPRGKFISPRLPFVSPSITVNFKGYVGLSAHQKIK